MHCAIIYDFDGTLAQGDCAEHGLMPSLGIENKTEFWNNVKELTKEKDADEILMYLWKLYEIANKRNELIKLSNTYLQNYGKKIPLFKGVESWFDIINRYAADNGIGLSHYIISSGLEEMIKGTSIAKNFKKIFACKYSYNKTGIPEWPALSINYTTKTQFLFRINKGIENCWDNSAVNRFVEPSLRPIPFSNMIYIGDGDTDIPAMKMVKNQGGHSIAVFNPDLWEKETTQNKIQKLIAEERTDYVVPADYQEHSQLMVSVKGILQLIKRKNS
ncbi:MAG TPA: haloacid dehalogenase-like hydrolase [Paludibacteraceae bacterium]|jgi:2-hydroxy-3-keto-5-methylthiopentenyl-1-phosphate phosphatase|nr:haloacid dehalogenase-like hydrolase [Paludibacteraceae bacterium]HOU69621.1 haloacid dehalogenase-like hydrolase [Paludibacteraceae bacterium]HPH63977.1 haloacid dehalogenase-like hydrolase [Paludibacteraceae bacterium]